MKNESQIERGFEALTSNLMSTLNPPLADLSQKPLKDCLDRAFSCILHKYNGNFSNMKEKEFSDEEMINIVQGGLAWYQDVRSAEEALSSVEHQLNPSIRNGIKRIAENKWIIENLDALEGLGKKLTLRYRTLIFQR